MSEGFLKQVSMFFFFAFLDEPLALRASRRAVIELKKNPASASKLVYVTRKLWDKYRDQLTRGRYKITGTRGWIPPESSDLTIWKEFQKNAEEDELHSVIWMHILKIPDVEISRGLGVTRGTVRYRAARGLRKIGILQLGEADGDLS